VVVFGEDSGAVQKKHKNIHYFFYESLSGWDFCLMFAAGTVPLQ